MSEEELLPGTLVKVIVLLPVILILKLLPELQSFSYTVPL